MKRIKLFGQLLLSLALAASMRADSNRPASSPETTGGPKISAVSTVKVFDSGDGFGAIKNLATLTDASVARIGDQWWLFLAGMDRTSRTIRLFSATLPPGAPLSDLHWSITTKNGDPATAQALIENPPAENWDATGLHCPAYVKGWDPTADGGKGAARERIYYAGSNNKTFQGPYAISYLERNGEKWTHPGGAPVFPATEEWESGSVFEPNLLYAGGKWRLWYCFGPSKNWRFGIGYAESADGKTNWSKHQIFLSEQHDAFDFAVVQRGDQYDAIVAHNPWAPESGDRHGLFFRQATKQSQLPGDWSGTEIPLLKPDPNVPWYRNGAWKPTFQWSDSDPNVFYLFFDGSYPSGLPLPQRPVHFTLGRIECRISGQP